MLTITYTNKRMHRRIKINLNRLFASLLILTSIITFTAYTIDFMRFPDKYITTWRYQLENDIQNGDTESIAYYNRVYKSNGINLFEY